MVTMWKRFGRVRDFVRRKPRLSDKAIFLAVEHELRNSIGLPRRRWHRHTEFSFLEPFIQAATQRAATAEAVGDADCAAAAWLLSLVLRAPRAAISQAQMDKHKHNFRNKEARVMELIDFNDAYVASVLAMPSDQLSTFNDDLKRLIDWFCKRVGAWSLSNAQFGAIAHGLSREIAVYNAIESAGFKVNMTTRTEDAFGIDMRVSDKFSERSINIDTKTTSAFHYRLIDLLREGRLSDADVDLAERRGYMAVLNGHGDEKVRVILWRINHSELGGITDFTFVEPEKLIDELREIIAEYGE